MALQIDYAKGEGGKGYLRVVVTSTDKRPGMGARVGYFVHPSMAARQANLVPDSYAEVDAPVTAAGIDVAAAYAHLKTLPDFATATDV